MYIIIYNKNNLYNNIFIKYLINKIKELFIKELNTELIKIWEIYFKEVLGVDVDLYKTILYSIDTLQITSTKHYYRLAINPNIVIGKMNMRLIALCKTINYGTSQVRAYPIFTKIFKSVSSNIGNYYNEFLKEVKNVGVLLWWGFNRKN